MKLVPDRHLKVNKTAIVWPADKRRYGVGGAFSKDGKEVVPEASQEVYKWLKDNKKSYFGKHIQEVTEDEFKKLQKPSEDKAKKKVKKEENSSSNTEE